MDPITILHLIFNLIGGTILVFYAWRLIFAGIIAIVTTLWNDFLVILEITGLRDMFANILEFLFQLFGGKLQLCKGSLKVIIKALLAFLRALISMLPYLRNAFKWIIDELQEFLNELEKSENEDETELEKSKDGQGILFDKIHLKVMFQFIFNFMLKFMLKLIFAFILMIVANYIILLLYNDIFFNYNVLVMFSDGVDFFH